MRIIHDLSEMIREIAVVNAMADESQRVPKLCELAYRPQADDMRNLDPFGPEYRERVIDIWKAISPPTSGRYSPAEDEQSPYLNEEEETIPNIYRAGSTRVLGDTVIAIGQVLCLLDATPGTKIIEYGAGHGTIALEAARAGCDVTVVDIEQKYLNIVTRRAARDGVSIRTVHGEFGHDCGFFDRVLFFEAFHHALDHVRALEAIRTRLNPGGKVIFAGEPIFGSASPWRETLPYPWGLRLDGLSFRAIQTYGWMELGFDETYFITALMRAGLIARFESCPSTSRGDAYIATAYETLDLGQPFVLPGWYDGEGTHRWSAVDDAVIPLRKHRGEIEVSIGPSGEPVTATLYSGGVSKTVEISAPCTVRLPASQELRVRTPLRKSTNPADPRSFGLAVRCIDFV